MMRDPQKQALVGVSLLSFGLGSIHAFSVLLLAMESEFGIPRSLGSMSYSLALIALALAVLFGHRMYGRLRPPTYVAVTGIIAAGGCVLAAISPNVGLIWFGFGLVFGGANGMGYGYALQFSGRIFPESRGFAMGVVTACYALGAVVFPSPLRLFVESGGWTQAMLFLAASLIVCAALSATVLSVSRVHYDRDGENSPKPTHALTGEQALLWFAYCGAVVAGLMAIGHATGLIEVHGGSAAWVVAAPIVIAAANLLGSLLGGMMVDRLNGAKVLAVLALGSATALSVISLDLGLLVTMASLAAIGFAYGGTIAAYPAFISQRFGLHAGPVVYGRVFTAWAVAGLLGPFVAGALYDSHDNYQLALILAAAAAVGSAIAIGVMARNAEPH